VWAPMEALRCEQCGATLEIEPSSRTGRCLYCASPQVVALPPDPDRPEPTFVLPFDLPPERALEAARAWVQGSRFAPESFRRAKVEDIRGVYVPAYLYTAAVRADYQVSIGVRYTEVRQGRDGKVETKRETEWSSLYGVWEMWSEDEVVTASGGIPNEELQTVEPFDLRRLRAYAPELLLGFAAEVPTLPGERCRALAREELVAQVARRLERSFPGDTYRSFHHQTEVGDEDLEPVLLPLWVLPVRYGKDERMVRLLVNGQTGRVTGDRPLSWVKVLLAVAGVVGLLGGLLYLLKGAVG